MRETHNKKYRLINRYQSFDVWNDLYIYIIFTFDFAYKSKTINNQIIVADVCVNMNIHMAFERQLTHIVDHIINKNKNCGI